LGNYFTTITFINIHNIKHICSMKKLLLFFGIFLRLSILFANNVAVSSVSTPDAQHVQFTLTWDNSWYSSATSYDAVWIFIKAQNCSGTTTWDHVSLSTLAGDHTATGGFYVEPAVSDGLGVFVRRNSNGFGSASTTVTVKLAAAYGTMNWQVNAVEMVWIPTGTFQVGDGSTVNTAGTGSSYNFGTSNLTMPYTINTENSIAASAFQNDKGLVWCGSGSNVDGAVPRNLLLSNSFPKGYNGFYCMKYEISQSQYAAFLNDLSLVQQGNRTTVPPASAIGTYAMTGGVVAVNRNSVVVKTPATATSPAVYDCDLDHNGTYGDGGDIACNFLSFSDLAAYLDWAALRPMTELEYEKICRGTNSPNIREYPWENTTMTIANSSALTNPGASNEVSTTTGTGLCAYGSAPGTGPLRCGFAATAVTGQAAAGATCYGVMDMAGNVWEQCMQVGWTYLVNGSCYTTFTFPVGGVIYTGVVGDGTLDVNGNADASNWGNSNYTILKGGSWNCANTAAGLQKAQISDRSQVLNLASYANSARTNEIGGRGVRKP
jgi:formylglycine-generating enzyme required for sulfatase activity